VAVNKIKVSILVFALFFITGYAQAENIWFSPLTAIPEDPTGARSLVLGVTSYGDALEVTATGPVADGDFKWVVLGLTTQTNKTIKGVKVCYEVITASPSSTYISQVRLTTMTTPDFSTIIHDDPTNLTSTNPTCYTSNTVKPKPKVSGTTTLSLKMVFGNASDKIRIGGVNLIY
jgi:hypothetical protein